MTRGPTTSWFDMLRRDRSMFVLLASFVLLLQAMQPLALASQANGGGPFVICTNNEVDPGQSQLHIDCAKCIASGCRIMPVEVPDTGAANGLPLAQPAETEIRWRVSVCLTEPASRATQLPPARAPPVSV